LQRTYGAAHTSAIPRHTCPYLHSDFPGHTGHFGAERGRFAHKNQQRSQKIDADFEIVLLIMNGLSAILRQFEWKITRGTGIRDQKGKDQGVEGRDFGLAVDLCFGDHGLSMRRRG
jgi:hypothetical protein